MTPIDDQFAEAITRHQSGDLAGAEELYRKVIASNPGHAGALSNLGVIVVKSGRIEEAVQLYRSAIAANPQLLDSHFNLGNLYRKMGRFQEAANAFQMVLRLDPDHARAYLNLGLTALDLGDATAGIDCFRRATVLDPNFGDAFNLLGDTLTRVGCTEEAVEVFREFATRFPDDARAHHNFGLSLATCGEYEAAISELELALKLRPNYPDAHNSLGIWLEAAGRTDEAQHHYLDAIEHRPEFAEAWSNLGTSLTEQGRITEAIRALRKAMALRLDHRTGSNLMLTLAYSSNVTPKQLRDEHAEWATKFADPLTPSSKPSVKADGKRRLKIGYVSSDFRRHPVARLIEALLTHHDRGAVHVTCYASLSRPDETTQNLRRLADNWHQVAHLHDAALAEQIRTEEIDILIDLNGHTAGHRLLALARKPAPLQGTLFGYPCTTGLKAIDFRISDSFASPPEADAYSVESILRLPDMGWVYNPPENAPAVNALPSASRRTFTFGCLNNPAKLSDTCLQAWAAILKAVAKSRLVLLAGQSAEGAKALSDRFTKLGIASDRLELVYRLPANEYFEAYQPLDLCLDPFPFNGMTTTCDALWMGLPVLSLEGRDTRSRQGVSILNNLGLPEFVADTPEKLVELAAIWSDQRTGLADLRASLREMMQQTPVTNAAQFVRHLETALREMWQETAN